MPDLDALRVRGWDVHEPAWSRFGGVLEARGLDQPTVQVRFRNSVRATAQAMLLAACAAADGVPTERERVLEEAFSRAASTVEHAMNLAETPQDGDYYRDALRAARAALNPTKEAPSD